METVFTLLLVYCLSTVVIGTPFFLVKLWEDAVLPEERKRAAIISLLLPLWISFMPLITIVCLLYLFARYVILPLIRFARWKKPKPIDPKTGPL